MLVNATNQTLETFPIVFFVHERAPANTVFRLLSSLIISPKQVVLGMALNSGTDLLGEIGTGSQQDKEDAASRCYYAATVSVPVEIILSLTNSELRLPRRFMPSSL